MAIHTPHAPPVRALAEVFGELAPLDEEISPNAVLLAAPKVPLAPSARLRHCEIPALGGAGLTLQSFAERIYGTPTTLGWWPSLMEDTAAALQEMAEPRLPDLAGLVELFENASEGRSSVTVHALLENVLPRMDVPTDLPLVEAELSALGDLELEFEAFVQWLSALCSDLREFEAAGVDGEA